MKTIIPFALLTCLLFLMACSSENANTPGTAPATTPAPAPASVATTKAPTQAVPATAPSITQEDLDKVKTNSTTTSNKPADTKVVAWVDKLNIRDKPSTKGKVIASAKENESLTLTGEKTDHTETIELRGKSYTEPWVKVTTQDGKSGWVFQGAVKRPGENKGNALNTANKFTYPHFGTFDLTAWKKIDTKNSAGGDAENETTTYKKGGQFLEISITDVGEYGWTKTFKLMDANKKGLKERSVEFMSDLNAAGDDYVQTMTETVKDFSTTPGKQYTRSNELKKSWFEYKPDMAKGDWKSSNL